MRDQIANEVVIEFFFEVFNVVHKTSYLLFVGILLSAIHVESIQEVFIGDLILLLSFLLVVLEDFPDVFANEAFELCAQGLWQMHAHVPVEEALLSVRLFDTAEVVGIFEQEDTPVLSWN